MRCSAATFLTHASTTTVAAQPREMGYSPLLQGRQTNDRAFPQEKGPSAKATAKGPSTCGHSSYIPRPVTIRQLYRAVLDVSDASSLPAHTSPASRLGVGTIMLDGAPCHVVTICGRVVRVDAAVEGHSDTCAIRRGSAASSPVSSSLSTSRQHDVVWISDNTGLLGVLQPQPRRPRSQLNAAAAWAGDDVSPGGAHRNQATAAARDTSNAQEDTCEDGGVCSNPLRHPPRQAPAFSLFPRGETHFADTCNLDDETDLDVAFDANELYVGDYVVCTGALAFADLDRTVALTMKPYAQAFRQAALAAVTTSAARALTLPSMKGSPGEKRESSSMHRGPPSADHVYVLLPGSEVPLRLDAARAALGLVGELPPQTRYLTEQQARRWDDGQAGAASSESAETGGVGIPADLEAPEVAAKPKVPFGNEAAAGSAHVSTCLSASGAVPSLFCVKGSARVLLDSNESLFWWLSAVETHLRLAALEKRET